MVCKRITIMSVQMKVVTLADIQGHIKFKASISSRSWTCTLFLVNEVKKYIW